MNNFVTFKDEKCVVDNCNNTVKWNSFSTLCDSCSKKYKSKSYCGCCKKIINNIDLIDLTGKPMMEQHITIFGCPKCKNKVIDAQYTIKGFGYKHNF